MKHATQIAFGVCAMLALAACSGEKETPLPEIVAIGKSADTYVYKLQVNRIGQGFSIHNFTWDRYNVVEDRWIFLSKDRGRIPAEGVAVGMFETLPGPEKFRGYVDIDSATMVISLENFDNDGSKWVPYKYNGRFRVVEKD